MNDTHRQSVLAQGPWLERMARSLVGDADRSKDVVQATYLSAMHASKSEDSPMRPWLKRIALNALRMEHRTSSRRKLREESYSASTLCASRPSTGFDDVRKKQASDALCQAVNQLDASHQTKIANAPVLTTTNEQIPPNAFFGAPKSAVAKTTKMAIAPLKTNGQSTVTPNLPPRSRLRFAFDVEDENGRGQPKKTDSVMDSGHDVMEMWAECYESSLAGDPSFDDFYGDIKIDVTLIKDASLGWITQDAKYSDTSKLKMDAGFEECVSQSSFAFSVDSEKTPGTHRIVHATITIAESNDVAKQQQKDFAECIAELKHRNPQAAEQFKQGVLADDPTFDQCMRQAMGVPEQVEQSTEEVIPNELIQPCMDELKRRKPSLFVDGSNSGGTIDDAIFMECVDNIVAEQTI